MKAEQNIELVSRSAVTALQEKYNEYKKAEIESIQATFYNSNGTFTVIDGAKEREERKAKILKELYGLTDEFYGAMQVLNELPSAQPEQRWIPCSERLPEDVGHYLVTIECRSSDSKKRFISIAVKDSRGWFSDENIIAWQPLPEPYKESEE